jgi:hypothetical protein
MIPIEHLEQQYQTLLSDFRAGRMSLAAFEAGVDRLGFQDEAGRYWQIGAQSGAWYFYDGQQWQRATPPRPLVTSNGFSRAERTEAVATSRPFVGVLLATFVILLLLPLLVLPGVGASPPTGPLADPSPRPPLDDGSGGGGGGGGGGSEAARSAILGKLTDLTTNQPGAGLEVSVSGAIVRTDTDGSYSITGLHAGQYTVYPALETHQGTAAQGPVFVNLDGRNNAIVDLAYYSSGAAPTDTPQAAAVIAPVTTPSPAKAPPLLPESGGPAQVQPLVLIWAGLLLLAAGGLLYQTHPIDPKNLPT